MTAAAGTSSAKRTSGATTPPESPPPEFAVDPDGYRYRVDTGEVVGHVDQAEGRFRIVTPEGVDWVLGLVMAQQLRLRSVESERAAINANLDGMAADAAAKLAWLKFRFGAEVREQALRDLAEAGGRKKSVHYPRGKVSSRTSPGSSTVTDPGLALAFVEENAPDQLKYQKPSLAAIEAAAARYAEQMGEEPDTGAFLRKAGPRESWTIETGLGPIRLDGPEDPETREEPDRDE